MISRTCSSLAVFAIVVLTQWAVVQAAEATRFSGGGQQAVRRGPWKAVRRKVLQDPTKTVELYNLDTDLAETTDVAAQHPGIAAEMSQLMQRSHTPNEHYAWKAGPAKAGGKKNCPPPSHAGQ